MLYLTGLLIADFIQPPLLLLFTLSITVAVVAIAVTRLRPILVWPLMVLTGWTNLVCHTAIISPQDMRTILDGNHEDVAVRGVLREKPSGRPSSLDHAQIVRTIAELQVTELRRAGDWQPASGRIVVFTRGTPGPEYFAGQPVEVSGIISFPPPPIAPGLFNYKKYLQRQGIYFQLRSMSTSEWRLLESHQAVPPTSDRFLAWAQSTLGRGLPEQDESLRLLWSMTLGWRNVLPNDVYEPFVESGTMHIFAISGLHIALIAGILVAVLRVMQIPRFYCGAVVIPLIWFYTIATGLQPSAIRATIMMSIIVGGWALKRPSNLLNSLAAAALVILLWQPQQLFQAGFQLSFFVVLSIALFLPPLEKLRDLLLQTDPLRPAKLLPRWQRAVRPVLHWLMSAVAVSLAAWLGAWPLTVYYFHIFSPVTLLANLIVVPLSSAALASSLGSLFFGAWFPWVAELFNHSAWFWMTCMTGISRWAAGLPGAFFYVSSLTLPDFAIYYGALFGLMSGWLLSEKGRRWALAGVLVAGIYYFDRWHDAKHTTTVTAIPLNGGSAVFCDAPGREHDLLVNCGNTNSVHQVLKPFLRAQGVNSISRLLLTHGDLRHIGGTEPLCELVHIGEIVTTDVRFRSSTYRRIIQELPHRPERSLSVSRGDSISGWAVLHPVETDDFTQADDNTVVLMANFHGTRLLLLSDLGKPGQNALMEREPDLRADIVIAGLPEKGEPLSDALLDAIQPGVIVVVDSERPATKRATSRLVSRLEQRGVPVLCTRSTGAVTINLTKHGWHLRTADGQSMTPENVPVQRAVSGDSQFDENDLEMPDER